MIQHKRYKNYSDNWFIFGGCHYMSRTTLQRKIDEYCRMSKVKRITPHEFRHSLVSLMYNQNLPIKAITAQIGDTEEMVINTYSHLFESTTKQVHDFIEKI